MKLFTSDQSDPIPTSNVEHVLVLQWGDADAIVMLTPVLRAIRNALPNAELSLMTSAVGGEMAPLLPWVDHVMVDPSVGQDGAGSRSINPREEIAFIERLRRHNFSVALIFNSVAQSTTRAAFACYLAGIPYRVGFAKGMSASVLSHSLPSPEDDLHQVDRDLALLRAIGISEEDRQTELNIPENVENRANELLGMAGLKLDTPYMIVAPESIHDSGGCFPYHYEAVTRILASQIEQQLVLVGSDTKAASLQPILQMAHENLHGNLFSLVGKTTLPELAAIVRQASLTLTDHSISMQFADAFRCPMVLLHTEADMVHQWMPRNAQVRLVRYPANCPYCNQAGCTNGIHCPNPRPEEVAVAALEMLTKQTYKQPSYRQIFPDRLASERNNPSPARSL